MCVAAALGIIFPFNLAIGIPLDARWVEWLAGWRRGSRRKPAQVAWRTTVAQSAGDRFTAGSIVH